MCICNDDDGKVIQYYLLMYSALNSEFERRDSKGSFTFGTGFSAFLKCVQLIPMFYQKIQQLLNHADI